MNNQNPQSKHLPTKEEMLKSIKDKMLKELEWYNMWDFRQVFVWDVLSYINQLYQAKMADTFNKWDFDCSKPSWDKHQKKNQLWYQWTILYLFTTLWLHPTEPINKQPEWCIKFVYSLLSAIQ